MYLQHSFSCCARLTGLRYHDCAYAFFESGMHWCILVEAKEKDDGASAWQRTFFQGYGSNEMLRNLAGLSKRSKT